MADTARFPARGHDHPTEVLPTPGAARVPSPDRQDLPYGLAPLAPAAPSLVFPPIAPVAGPVVGYVERRRSPAVGVAASLFVPGLGSIVNGSPGRGVMILATSLFAILLDLTILGAVIGLPLGFACWVWGLVDGYDSAERHNLRNGL